MWKKEIERAEREKRAKRERKAYRASREREKSIGR